MTYYKKQLENINTKKGYPICVNFNNQTNWIDLNKESIPVIIEYLKNL